MKLKPQTKYDKAALTKRLHQICDRYKNKFWSAVTEQDIRDDIYTYLSKWGIYARALDVWCDEEGYVHVSVEEYYPLNVVN